jgi:hypothetical protein
VEEETGDGVSWMSGDRRPYVALALTLIEVFHRSARVHAIKTINSIKFEAELL